MKKINKQASAIIVVIFTSMVFLVYTASTFSDILHLKNMSEKYVADLHVLYENEYLGNSDISVTIPQGFYYVGGTKETGLVISDNVDDKNKGVNAELLGNQFVWIPVEYVSTGILDANGLDSGFTSVFKTGEYDSATKKMTATTEYKEPYSTNTYTEEAIEYYNMMKSVQKNHGFYIARYIAGKENDKVVIKKGADIYNVAWGDSMTEIGTAGAVYLSRNMYLANTAVKSTLCYGVEWDAMLNYISDSGYDLEALDLTVANNIYGLCTGTDQHLQWTMEYSSDSSEQRVKRGAMEVTSSSWGYQKMNMYSRFVGTYSPDDAIDCTGPWNIYCCFRPAIYINNI